MFHELAGRTDTESQGDYNYIDGDGDGDGEAMMISPIFDLSKFYFGIIARLSTRVIN